MTSAITFGTGRPHQPPEVPSTFLDVVLAPDALNRRLAGLVFDLQALY